MAGDGPARARHVLMLLLVTVTVLGATAAAAGAVSFPLGGLFSVSCPSVSLCVFVHEGGTEFVYSTNPAAGRWAVGARFTPTAAFAYVRCSPGRRPVCLAADENAEQFLLSQNPTGGARAWKSARLPRAPTHGPARVAEAGPGYPVACPSARMCLIGTSDGLLVSRNPTGGTRAWKYMRLFRGEFQGISHLSCRSVNLCAASGGPGDVSNTRQSVWTSTRPLVASSWHQRPIPFEMEGVLACASLSLCVIDGPASGISGVSTNPLTGPWKSVSNPTPDVTTGVACPSPGRCLAVSYGGEVSTLMNSGPEADTWVPAGAVAPVDVSGEIAGYVNDLACPSQHVCVAVGATNFHGAFWTTTDAQDPTPRWTLTETDGTGPATR